MTTVQNPMRRRGRRFVPQDAAHGYHIGWYPICRSEELVPGEIFGAPFLNGRVVAMRDDGGAPSVLSAYCRHLGADLSIADVRDGCIVCPFHHWHYDVTGTCVKIPQDPDRIPDGARLWPFPAAESLGLVWAWHGDDDPGPLPAFTGHATEDLVVRVSANLHRHPVEPWVAIANSVDIQHLRELHGLRVEVDIDRLLNDAGDIDYEGTIGDPLLGDMRSWVRVFGTSCITLTFRPVAGGDDILMASAMTPEPGGGCRNYQIAAATAGDRSTERLAHVDALLEMGLAFGDQLVREDTPVIDGIHIRDDVLLPVDRALGRYFRYVREFPRSNTACDFLE